MPNGFAEGLGKIGSSIARGITAQSERQRQEEDLFASLLLGAAQAPEELESLFRTLAKERTGRDLPAIQRAPKAFGLRRVKDVPNLFTKYPQHGDLTVDELLRIVPRAREEFDVGAREEREREEKERRDAEVQRQVNFFTQRYPGVPLPSHLVTAMKASGFPIRTRQVDVTAPLTLGGRGAPIEAIREQAGKTVQIPTGEREEVEDLPEAQAIPILLPSGQRVNLLDLPAGAQTAILTRMYDQQSMVFVNGRWVTQNVADAIILADHKAGLVKRYRFRVGGVEMELTPSEYAAIMQAQTARARAARGGGVTATPTPEGTGRYRAIAPATKAGQTRFLDTQTGAVVSISEMRQRAKAKDADAARVLGIAEPTPRHQVELDKVEDEMRRVGAAIGVMNRKDPNRRVLESRLKILTIRRRTLLGLINLGTEETPTPENDPLGIR